MYAILALLLLASSLFAQQRPPINVFDQLEPFRQYYSSRDEWPRAHGYKPYMRYLYDVEQRAYPDSTIPAGARWEAFQQMGRMPRVTLDEPWAALGPFNHGGRTRVLRFHPNNPEIMFAGSVGGGLFRSDDGGDYWYPITDMLPNLAVGCLDIAASNPNIMYMGTGEGYFNGDAIGGVGLFKSIDGGVTWALTSMNYNYSSGTCILRVNVDPRDANIVLASTGEGLYRSTNGGDSFTLVRAGNINEVKRDPQDPDVLLCAAGYPYGSGVNGVYRSTDNGATWVNANTGLPNPTIIGRIVLSFAPSNSLVVYAGISGDFDFNGSEMIGVYRSADNGQTWERMSQDGETSHYASQGWYDMALAVDPDDPLTVFNAGLDIYRTVNGGESWSQRSWWWHAYGEPSFAHADHHELIFHPENSDELWDVSDGGIFVSYDNGQTWNEKNLGYNTFQFYAMGNATLDTVFALGGTQDNGTTRYSGSGDWESEFGGDGGYCVIDYTNNNTFYVEYQNGNRYRTDDGGSNFAEINPGIIGGGPWVTPIVQDPFAPNTIYTTTNSSGASVWMSTNQGRNSSWVNIGPVGNSNQVLAASPAVPGRLYLGSGSSVYRYDAADGNWVNVSGNMNGSYITHVIPDPFDPNTVYVTKSGFNGGQVWRSTTAGGQWTNITGNLPNAPVQDLAVDLNNPTTLYVGGDLGVYYTTDAGQTWAILGEGLPVVRVDDMDIQPQTGALRVATHGRGMWEIPTSAATLAMLYPNGTETLATGGSVTIRWSGIAVGGDVTLAVNRGYPGGNWETIAANIDNDGAHPWIVTGPVTDHARFRIVHTTDGSLSDTSNADSRIANPGVVVLSPNGGETVFTGTNDTIWFERTLTDGFLTIEINRNFPNGPWEMLADNVTHPQYYVWRVMQPGGENCRIKITSIEQEWLSDESDGDFVMRAPMMTIQSPNGGETVQLEQPYDIMWSAAEFVGTFRILLNRSYPNGNWELLAPTTENDSSFMWTPRGAATTTARIRLATALDPLGTFVESAQDFTIDDGTPATEEIPRAFAVSEAYPNPFNPQTQISIAVPVRTQVTARVTNELGQTVATLFDGTREAGQYTLTFDGAAFASGIYYLRVDGAGTTISRKLVLLK